MCFTVSIALFVIFLNFLLVKFSKMFTTHRILWDAYFKHEEIGFVKAVFFRFLQIYVSYRSEKNCLLDFP